MTERQGRGRAEVRDPAQAIAMAKCWLATWVGRAGEGFGLPKVSSFHPDSCGFCDMPRDLIITMLEEFRDWSHISPIKSDSSATDEEVPLRLEIEQWQTISAAEQSIRVRRAQGYFEPDRGRTAEDRRNPW